MWCISPTVSLHVNCCSERWWLTRFTLITLRIIHLTQGHFYLCAKYGGLLSDCFALSTLSMLSLTWKACHPCSLSRCKCEPPEKAKQPIQDSPLTTTNPSHLTSHCVHRNHWYHFLPPVLHWLPQFPPYLPCPVSFHLLTKTRAVFTTKISLTTCWQLAWSIWRVWP